MIKVKFTKKVTYESELPDDFALDGAIFDEGVLISYCESELSEPRNDNTWIMEDEIHGIEYEYNGKKHKISKKEYDKFVEDREKAERCYECSANGDDDNCSECPFFED
jgi:hypothetical protein